MNNLEDVYFDSMYRRNIEPNFFCSRDYWKFNGWKALYKNGYIVILDEDGNSMLPAYDLSRKEFDFNKIYFWAGFPNFEKGKFLDYEFIYDPRNFLNLEGKKWKLFRKNIRKFRNEIENELFLSRIDNIEIERFLDKWINENNGKEWYEPEVMIKYFFGKKSRGRLGLYGKKSQKLYSIMLSDENYRYINFRYLLTLNYPKIQDISRLFFYYWAINQNKWVNDGGCLDNKGLEWYKKRLNPVKINIIYSKE